MDASKKMAERQNVDVEVQEVNGKQLSGKELLKQMGDDKKEATEPRSKDQRVQFSLFLICEVCFCLSLYFTSLIFC